MKRNTVLILVGILVGSAMCSLNLMAGTIKANGLNQKDLYSFIVNTLTLANESKTDHNNLVATHNAVFAHYTGMRMVLVNYTGSTMRTQISNRTLPSGASTATTAASDLSLTQ